jgi:CheY-like chemotaxis protein
MIVPKRILLAEDDPRDQELTVMALSEYLPANEIAVVNDGVELLDYLLRRGKFADMPAGNPALLLLDLKIPKVDGLQVLREIRRTPELRLLPVVMLTSSNQEADIAECYNLGASAYVVKPVDFHDFVEAVKKTQMFWALVNEPPPGTVPK